MRFRQLIITGVALTITLTTFVAAVAQTPTPALTKTAYYWDLGLSIKYPENWLPPRYIAGQMFLYAAPPSTDGKITQPTCVMEIYNSAHALNLPKDAPFDVIAAQASTGKNVTIEPGGPTTIAGLDAAFVSVSHEVVPNSDTDKTLGQTAAFRVPDGRIGVLICISGRDAWPDFFPTLGQMYGQISLLKPADYTLPTFGSLIGIYGPGGVRFAIPDHWADKSQGTNQIAHTYYDSDTIIYRDGSGYANGLLLAIDVQPLTQGMSLHDMLVKIVEPEPQDVITNITVGGQPGIQITYTEPQTGQAITIVGFLAQNAQDKTVIDIFRWTVPGMLVDISRPTFDTILNSVKFDKTPPTPQPTATATATAQS